MSQSNDGYQIHIALVDEATGITLATKMSRVHASDLKAGKVLLDHKVSEIWRDLFVALPCEGVA